MRYGRMAASYRKFLGFEDDFLKPRALSILSSSRLAFFIELVFL